MGIKVFNIVEVYFEDCKVFVENFFGGKELNKYINFSIFLKVIYMYDIYKFMYKSCKSV